MADAPRPGAIIAGYQLDEEIGRGGMALVFAARDLRLERWVALKVLPAALGANFSFRQRFIRESRAAALVDDPHIVPIFDAGEFGGVLYIAMRLVNGGDVGTLLRRSGALTPARTAGLVSPVAGALDAAHADGLVHRDVKPANMLLDSRPGRPDHVYLSDFGLSKDAWSPGLTSAGVFVGTPYYVAPEQIGKATADGRADQYSLACAAFEMLSGEPPFQGPNPMAVLHAHVYDQPPSLSSVRPDLPPAASAVLARALDKDPDSRYPTCQDFADSLRAALGQPPYTVEPPSTRAQPPISGSTPARSPDQAAEADQSRPGTIPPGVVPHRTRRRGLVALAVSAAVILAGGIGATIALIGHLGGRAQIAQHGGRAQTVRPMIAIPAATLRGVVTTTGVVWAFGGTCASRCDTGHGPALIEQFSGTSWRRVRNPVTGARLLAGAAGPAGTFWAAGYQCMRSCGRRLERDATLIYRWDGHALVRLPSPSPGRSGRLTGIAVARDGAAFATGYYCTRACGTVQEFDSPLLLTWKHGRWSRLPAADALQRASAVRLEGVSIGPDGKVWAVGYSCHPGCSNFDPEETDQPLILTSGAAGWSNVSVPDASAGGALSAVTASVPGGAWFVGQSKDQGLVLHWANGSWRPVPPTPSFSGAAFLTGVSAGPGGSIWAVGAYCVVPGLACFATYHGLAMRLDNSGWDVVTDPVAQGRGQLAGVDVGQGGTALVVGYSCLSECRTLSGPQRDQTLMLRLHGLAATASRQVRSGT